MNWRSLLVLDAYRAQTTPGIKFELEMNHTNLVVIPAGLTYRLQPLDVVINRPFKYKIKNKWTEWMLHQAPNEIGCKPGRALIARWVKEAWDEIPKEIIQKAFLKCGISNLLDGTEEHFMNEDIEEITGLAKDLSISEDEELWDEELIEMEGCVL